MKIIKTFIKDLLVIEGKIHKDSRGYFREVLLEKFLKKKFIFNVVSKSKKNVIRGLHYQMKKPQGKFISVMKGKIIDVAVDLRKNSKTYGKHFSIEISQKSNFSLYIPEKFAHGFLCLSNECAVYYKCTNYRDKNSETTIKWDDKNLNIQWPIKKPLLSKKDKVGIRFLDFK